MEQIPEPDWKVLRGIRDAALDRLCARILSEIGEIAFDAGKTNHERYLEIFSHIQQRDDDVANAFNGLSRSKALNRILIMRNMGLITDEEFARFSDETRLRIESFLKFAAG